MAHVAYPADQLESGDRIMVNVEILTVAQVVLGTIRVGPDKGVRYAHVYFPDRTMMEFNSDTTWYTTVLNARPN